MKMLQKKYLGQKVWSIFLFSISFILNLSSAFCQYSPNAPVLIGDSVTFGGYSYGSGNCYPSEVKYTHSNNDFFIEFLGSPPYFNFQLSFIFAFVPTRVGVENDTFTIRVWWACPHGYIDTLGPFIVRGVGLSDSISTIQFKDIDSANF